MAKYKPKAFEVEAWQWDGSYERAVEILNIIGADHINIYYSPFSDDVTRVTIITLEGRINASPHDYIVRGTRGECWAVKPHIFEEKYARVTDEDSVEANR